MRVIINADDFGYHANANRAICEGFRKGFISNTTAMVTMPDFEAGLELAKKEGFVDRMGLHINLSAGRPLTDGIRRSRIFCNKDGEFNFCIRKYRIWRFWLPESVKPLIAEEIRAQMRLFIKYGLTERHYDSHGQVGVYWPILPIVLQCAKEFGFRSTRMFINMSANPHNANMSFLRWRYIRHVDNVIEAFGLKKTSHLGLSWDLARMVDTLPNNATVEVMTHPQYRSSDLELSDAGDMMDFDVPYYKSFGPLLENKGKFDLISFNEL